ncbi:MAG: 16S rRNA (cytosine(1402)-N(4))-methyltransferase RsmH [Spirochaetes bacterium]|jgi:16S rRNA (cytosine1402-N4)-methyltransferase|nr:16S rRNA (cytosine(1402)-N(4))-methyltransferase RsmH [Spirochaetota bacterium]
MRHNTDDTGSEEFSHEPVLWREVLHFIEDSPLRGEGVLVDCTLGEGGHSELILKKFSRIKILAFERDPEILDVAKKRLEGFGGRIEFINDNFSNISDRIGEMAGGIGYILFDFGISSYHFDRSGRGFAISRDERLDMRLDGAGRDASRVVNGLTEKELADIFYRYGEERWSRRIASYIAARRREKVIETTTDLAEIVLSAIPARYRVRNIHPATRVFQALRIFVNDELAAIEKGLSGAFGLLSNAGRIMAISFHSLEDRLVKNSFRRMADDGHTVRILTKKPLCAQDDEVAGNTRARSAKLRVCERIMEPVS